MFQLFWLNLAFFWKLGASKNWLFSLHLTSILHSFELTWKYKVTSFYYIFNRCEENWIAKERVRWKLTDLFHQMHIWVSWTMVKGRQEGSSSCYLGRMRKVRRFRRLSSKYMNMIITIIRENDARKEQDKGLD